MEPDLNTNPYLQQEVFTVSPIRLRWMLVNRAEELCLLVGKLWDDDKHSESIQWLIRIREILCELLDGIVDRNNPVSQSVSDFYIFLLRLLNDVDRDHSPKQLQVLRELLAIEGETWRLACEKFENAQHLPSSPAGSKQPLQLPANRSLSDNALHAFVDTPHSTSGGFSLEV